MNIDKFLGVLVVKFFYYWDSNVRIKTLKLLYVEKRIKYLFFYHVGFLKVDGSNVKITFKILANLFLVHLFRLCSLDLGRSL